VVACGLGGVYTEVWREVALRVAPVDVEEAMVMIGELKSLPLFQGARGELPSDLGALAGVLADFSQLPFRYPKLSEVDLNPVFVFPEGLVIGDVRIISRSD
jgi:acetyltransferase